MYFKERKFREEKTNEKSTKRFSQWFVQTSPNKRSLLPKKIINSQHKKTT